METQTRKIYERPEDLIKERALLDRFLARPSTATYEIVKLHKHERIDFLVLSFAKHFDDDNNPVPLWFECKNRSFKYGAFKFHWLSEHKWRRLLGLAQAGQTCFVLFGLLGADYWYQVGALADFQITLGGRKDRGDPLDQEHVINLPYEIFNRF